MRNSNMECGDPTKAWDWLVYMPTEIQSRAENPIGEVFTEHGVSLTREFAESLLAGLSPSDGYKRRLLKQMVRDVDEWDPNVADPICIGPDGRMHNGKHRCLTVANTGKPITVSIQFNTPRSEHGGKGRAFAASDLIALRHPDIANAGRVASVAAMMWLVDQALEPMGSKECPDSVEIADAYDRHPTIKRSVAYVASMRWPRGWKRPALAYLHHRIARYDIEAANGFLEHLNDADGLSPTGNVMAENCQNFRDAVKREVSAARPIKRWKRAFYSWLMKTWKASVDGRDTGRLMFNHREPLPPFSPPKTREPSPTR